MRRLLTALATVVVLLVPAGTAAAGTDDYPPTFPSSCNINAPQVAVGQRVHLVIEVASNSNVPEVGTVALTVSTVDARAARAARVAPRAVVWTRSVRYEGTPLEVVGPELPRGRYRVTMAFTPDNAELVGCRNAAVLRVGGGGGDDTGGVTEPGALPNTGGPHLWLLLAGLGLVVAGGGLAGGSRRTRLA
ncbi:LPXTG-motif cell wall-anchored protein [Nocardioides sp. J9]|uniref:LPXTG cell wall anchor domain-containing protein n=1 Tax=Nocardioides sp. J9 TaxID=935844 RepID=UPI0011ACDB0D|nr:LPXTG cell wall anchor domain-containing protein [Nocardioides sp. J9]TWG90942.1 LPXTG-motif cell wall-anchored protein [Nocardioides sp. J9]TWH00738.1 LPXTG-motif cell wall-anchored protein [Nocardioides sp. J9]